MAALHVSSRNTDCETLALAGQRRRRTHVNTLAIVDRQGPSDLFHVLGVIAKNNVMSITSQTIQRHETNSFVTRRT